ncbi:MAG: 5'/3'-nucleotidase SurE [Chloroflexi bacterium GWB2_49_20]|nr:MAG: 5'/3'-nucleotidase SurE [Chloroflexi bacterium GWB2_49_20]OGN80325.1 MAG: 5'/3'-nucleotidase SurE [Chloroflexi bacterium GWC2_49_37]OGN86035.1 MAG: 5'/3'-nucleotidase SurE [Chloroflexi bacterium GWD2_49_16]HCC79334.1 5'/3'-nucleotidase SurE [Anaerolineae bacterium]HCM96445.1 5'/3'-nucleotidase SurE [Anaerolineae bacterium]
MEKKQILLTNDDGIQSPGLWAAAEVLSTLGYVTVVAPRLQSSGMGRSLPSSSDGIIRKETVQVSGKDWTVYAVGGSPAQAVQHGLLEIMPQHPHLVVSGINYGENVATGITISGTVGAALEAASMGIPALAISLQTATHLHLSYSTEVDFSIAAHFAAYFGRLLLERNFPQDVDLLKVDVPAQAGKQTPWQLTRVARQRYYDPDPPLRESWDQPANVRYHENMIIDQQNENSDVYVLRTRGLVSVTPISLDMTSRTDFTTLDKFMRD